MHSEQFALALPRTAARRLRTAVARTRAFVAATIAAGQAAGELRDDVPAAALAVVVLGAMQALAVSSAAGAEASVLSDALRVLLAPPPARTRRARRGRRA